MALLDRLEQQERLNDKAIRAAFERVPRTLFVTDPNDPQEVRAALSDRPLSLPGKQTISAPHMVAILLREARLSPGDRVLEVGAGSGWLAALAAHLVGEDGHVHGIEMRQELAELATRHLEALALTDRVTIVEGDGSKGWPEHAPYDVILVSCAAPHVPSPLVEQVALGGRLVIPVGGRGLQHLRVIERTDEGLAEHDRGTCAFVPMLGEEGW